MQQEILGKLMMQEGIKNPSGWVVKACLAAGASPNTKRRKARENAAPTNSCCCVCCRGPSDLPRRLLWSSVVRGRAAQLPRGHPVAMEGLPRGLKF